MRKTALKGVLAFALAAGATFATAATTTIAYAIPTFGDADGYVVDWNDDGSAYLSFLWGAGAGTYKDNGTQKLLTLTTPVSLIQDNYDCNGNLFQQQYDFKQFVFRPTGGNQRKGSTQVVEIGTITDLGGCTPGNVQHFGSHDAHGTNVEAYNFAARASEGDLVPGAQLVAFSDELAQPPQTFAGAVNPVTFGNGTLTFAGEDPIPYATSNGWIIFSLPDGSQRAYTRVTFDHTSGLQSWLVTSWANGHPNGGTFLTPGVTPDASAGFGDTAATARRWEEGMWINSGVKLRDDCYQDFTGQWVYRSKGQEEDIPTTWGMEGATLAIVRGGNQLREFTPVANYGRLHFTLQKISLLQNGQWVLVTPPRVNWLIDHGPATP
jgi:hypothetical protein